MIDTCRLIGTVLLMVGPAAMAGCPASECELGTEGCQCAETECLGGLSCLSGVCVVAPSPDGGVDTAADTPDTTLTDVLDAANELPGDVPTDGAADASDGADTSAFDVPADVPAEIPEPLTAQCPYDNTVATATLNEAVAEGALTPWTLGFNANGALSTIGETPCVAGDDTGFSPSTQTECYDAYECGGCPMVIGRRLINEIEDFYLAPFKLPVPAGCESFGGFYSVGGGS